MSCSGQWICPNIGVEPKKGKDKLTSTYLAHEYRNEILTELSWIGCPQLASRLFTKPVQALEQKKLGFNLHAELADMILDRTATPLLGFGAC